MNTDPELLKLLKEQNNLQRQLLRRTTRQGKRQESATRQLDKDNVEFLVIVTLAFTMMGIWGLKNAWLEFRASMPFSNTADSVSPESAPSTAPTNGGHWSVAGPVLQVGDLVGTFEVTSQAGNRQDPFGAGTRFHAGVDIAQPIGSPIFNPAGTDWKCIKSDSGGIGLEGSVPGYDVIIWHLDTCTGGSGAVIATSGNTGSRTTGPHTHIEFYTQASGALFTNATHDMVASFIAPDSLIAPPVAQVGDSSLSDAQIKAAIGNAEGTANPDGTPNHNYWGHDDPCTLNGSCPSRGRNVGFFSSDKSADPEQANAIELKTLRAAEEQLQQQSQAKFGSPLSKAAIMSALDLWNQAPAAGQDFVKFIPTADPTPAQIIDARAKTFIDPTTQRLNAPGLNNSWSQVVRDQTRRTDEILESLKLVK